MIFSDSSLAILPQVIKAIDEEIKLLITVEDDNNFVEFGPEGYHGYIIIKVINIKFNKNKSKNNAFIFFQIFFYLLLYLILRNYTLL